MKRYNFSKARKLIKKHEKNIDRASMGMGEDWFWTGETIWENGKFARPMKKGTKLCGIERSDWATPVLRMELKGGGTLEYDCFIKEGK